MKNICLAYGVSFMDLEVDVPVGKVKIRKVYCLQDSGKIINPQLAEGQMHGGVAMGIGYALTQLPDGRSTTTCWIIKFPPVWIFPTWKSALSKRTRIPPPSEPRDWQSRP